MRGFSILDANWNIGMAGSITIRTQPKCKYLRLHHSMNRGLSLQESTDGGITYEEEKKTTEDEFIKIVNDCSGREEWKWEFFELVWQASAEGFQRGEIHARNQILSQLKQL